MSSLDRTIDGDALVRHLTQDERTIDQGLVTRHGRSARTLVKEGPIRLTLIALAPGGDLPEHSADGPVSVHVVDGQFLFSAAGTTIRCARGTCWSWPRGCGTRPGRRRVGRSC